MKNSYLITKEKKLISELQLLENITHPTTKGGHLEQILLNFLREDLPKKYSVGTGFVIGLCKNEDNEEIKGYFRSKELDIVLFDEQENVNPLKLLRKKDFFAESVYACVSIKKELNISSLIKDKCNALDNLISAKKILPHAVTHQVISGRETSETAGTFVPKSIFTVAFGYTGSGLPTINTELQKKSKSYNYWW